MICSQSARGLIPNSNGQKGHVVGAQKARTELIIDQRNLVYEEKSKTNI
jgi:hypothetical protein